MNIKTKPSWLYVSSCLFCLVASGCEQTMSLYHSPVRQKEKKKVWALSAFSFIAQGGKYTVYLIQISLNCQKSHTQPGACTGGFSSISADSKWVLYWDISFFFFVFQKKKTLPFILKVMAPLEEATRCFTMSHEYCQIRGCGRKLKLSFINTHPKYTAETCTCIFIYTMVKLECFSENATSLARGRELFCSAHVYPVGAGNRYRRWKLSFVALKRTSGSPEAQLSCGRFFYLFYFYKISNLWLYTLDISLYKVLTVFQTCLACSMLISCVRALGQPYIFPELRVYLILPSNARPTRGYIYSKKKKKNGGYWVQDNK